MIDMRNVTQNMWEGKKSNFCFNNIIMHVNVNFFSIKGSQNYSINIYKINKWSQLLKCDPFLVDWQHAVAVAVSWQLSWIS